MVNQGLEGVRYLMVGQGLEGVRYLMVGPMESERREVRNLRRRLQLREAARQRSRRNLRHGCHCEDLPSGSGVQRGRQDHRQSPGLLHLQAVPQQQRDEGGDPRVSGRPRVDGE